MKNLGILISERALLLKSWSHALLAFHDLPDLLDVFPALFIFDIFAIQPDFLARSIVMALYSFIISSILQLQGMG